MSEKTAASADKTTETKSEKSVSQTQKSDSSQFFGSPVDRILFLHRTIGNQAVGRLISSSALQTKLSVNEPGDIYEQEADRVADQVMRMTCDPGDEECERKRKSEEEDEEIQRKPLEDIHQIQRYSESSPDVTPEIEENINSSKSGGQPLPESVRSFFEPRFDRGFSQVRIHNDSNAGNLNHALSARAFTTGKDIFFSEGAYRPETSGGMELLAHELTHVVQQSGDGIHHSLNGSKPEEVMKLDVGQRTQGNQDANSFLIYGAPAQVTQTITGIFHQILRTPQHGAAHVGGGETEGLALPNQQENAIIQVGGEGYSRQMLRITGEIAAGIGDLAEVQNLLLHPVVPDLTGIDAAIQQRQNDFRNMQAWVDDESGFFGHHQSLVHAQAGRTWVQNHLNTLTKDRYDEEGKFQAFNSWVPQANAFYSSLTRMQAQMNLLGVGSNLNAMVQALLHEIGVPAISAQPAEGDQPAQQAQAATGASAVGARQIDASRVTQSLPIPPPPPTDDTVTQAGLECSAAFQTMQTAYLGLQKNFSAQRVQEVNEQGEQARTRIQEINEIKKFIHQVGATIDTTAAVMNGAPAAITNVTDFMNRTGAQYGAIRNRRAILRGEAGRWNPTYTTIDANGNMVVRNMQTGMDLDPTIAPGEEGRQRPSPGSESSGDFPKIPTSIGGTLDAIAGFAYQDELLRLNQQLAAIEARCTAERVASEFIETVRMVRGYKDALNIYGVKANHLQQRLAERRRQYLEFGEALDRFAARDTQSQRAGEAPGRGKERYATVMVLGGQIREAIAVARMAIESDQVGDRAGLISWFNVIQSNREKPPAGPRLTGFGRQSQIHYISFPESERQAIEQMGDQSVTFRIRTDTIIRQLVPVDQAIVKMMMALHPGGGSQAY